MIYLDNAATTFPKAKSVYDVMDSVNREYAVNAGRGSYKIAQKASRLIDETKDLVRKLIHVDLSVPVVFSSSITIAINQIVNGLDVKDSSVIYVSPFEHNAVARSIYHLAKKKQILIKELPLNDYLEIDIEKMKYEFAKNKPDFVFCTHVSNVTGYILPIEDIFSESKKYNSINVLDSAQSLGLLDIWANLINVDIIAFAGHKTLYGPFGIGGFVNVTNVYLDEFICGGTGSDSLNLDMPSGKETKYEASSFNIVAVAGLNEALKVLDVPKCLKKEKELSEYLIEKLQESRNIHLYIPNDLSKHVGIVSFSVEGYNSDDVGMILDEDFDIAVRTGYHCAPYIHKYLKDESSGGTVRVGLGVFNEIDEINKLIEAINDL